MINHSLLERSDLGIPTRADQENGTAALFANKNLPEMSSEK